MTLGQDILTNPGIQGQDKFPGIRGGAHIVSKGGAHVDLVLSRCCRGTLGDPTSSPIGSICCRDSVVSHSLPAFVAITDSPAHDVRLDWSTDGCSAPVVQSTGRSFDFYNACRRHDFGYRNMSRFKNGRLWSEALRLRIDAQFRKDARASCTSKLRLTKVQCLAWAETYFRAVRSFGTP
jgi:hypothetical protein